MTRKKSGISGEIIRMMPLGKLSTNRFGTAVNPPITDEDFEALRSSIRQDGILTPLIAWSRNGTHTIVAGNNRYRIAKDLGIRTVPVILRSYTGDADAKRFVITDNLARRHMNAPQRAELALQLQQLMTVGRGKRTDLCFDKTKVNARAEAARQAGVSSVSMSQMKRVLESKDASIIESVRSGKMRLPSAVRLLTDQNPYTPSQRAALTSDEPVFSCVHGDNSDLIARVAQIYLKPGMVVADITYGRGMFWQQVDTANYDFRPSDLYPQAKRLQKMDLRSLKHADGTIDVIVLDPPYLSRSGKNSVYARRYRTQYAPKTYDGLISLYTAGMRECFRVLKPGGLCWLKCADDVQKGIFRATHCELLAAGADMGFVAADMFVLQRKSNGMQTNPIQYHSRRNHSYLWIMRKPPG